MITSDWHADLRSLLFRFGLTRLSQPYARPSTVFVDELDICGFESSPNNVQRGPSWLRSFFFELMDSHDPNARSVSQHLLAPA